MAVIDNLMYHLRCLFPLKMNFEINSFPSLTIQIIFTNLSRYCTTHIQYNQHVHNEEEEQRDSYFEYVLDKFSGIYHISKNDENCKYRKAKDCGQCQHNLISK